MTDAALIAFAAAGVLAAGNWISRATDNRRLEFVTKPGTMAALVAAAVLIEPRVGAQRWWFVAALVCSAAGDVLLMLPRERFVAGLVAFLVAHVAYVAGFALDADAGRAAALGLPIVAVGLAGPGRRIVAAVRTSHTPLFGPVLAYLTVISVMVVAAAGAARPVALAGAVSFYASDAMIAWNRFVRPFAAASVAIMVTYHLGQAAIVFSLV